MADINDAVSSILNDPNAMKQIKERCSAWGERSLPKNRALLPLGH